MNTLGLCLFFLARRRVYQHSLDRALHRLAEFPPSRHHAKVDLHRLIQIYTGMVACIDRLRTQAGTRITP